MSIYKRKLKLLFIKKSSFFVFNIIIGFILLFFFLGIGTKKNIQVHAQTILTFNAFGSLLSNGAAINLPEATVCAYSSSGVALTKSCFPFTNGHTGLIQIPYPKTNEYVTFILYLPTGWQIVGRNCTPILSAADCDATNTIPQQILFFTNRFPTGLPRQFDFEWHIAPIISPSVSPAPTCTAEICDGKDNNCNGTIDEGIAGCVNGCLSPLTSCSNACVDLTNSNNNCGGCGNVCSSGTSCSGGVCTTIPTTCTTDASCPRGYVCQIETGKCVAWSGQNISLKQSSTLSGMNVIHTIDISVPSTNTEAAWAFTFEDILSNLINNVSWTCTVKTPGTPKGGMANYPTRCSSKLAGAGSNTVTFGHTSNADPLIQPGGAIQVIINGTIIASAAPGSTILNTAAIKSYPGWTVGHFFTTGPSNYTTYPDANLADNTATTTVTVPGTSCPRDTFGNFDCSTDGCVKDSDFQLFKAQFGKSIISGDPNASTLKKFDLYPDNTNSINTADYEILRQNFNTCITR